jgi:signal transduction histidine kinase/FixJ family two-component response regulator
VSALGNVSLERRIKAEQIRAVYLHSPTTTTGSLIAGAFLVWVVWEKVPLGIVAAWLAALLVHQSIRFHSYRAYLRANPTVEESDRWGRLYIVATVIAGSIWGAAGVLFYVPDSLPDQTYLALILFGIVALTIPSISIYAPAFYPLVILVPMPFVARALGAGTKYEIALSIPLVIAMLIALMFGRKINLLVHESIGRRFENIDLIEALAREKEVAERARAAAEAANRSKSQFFAGASHDLRQPLHALGLFVAALSTRIRYPEVSIIVANINRSVDALQELFDELLDVSKIDGGAVQPKLVDFELDQVVGRLRHDFAPEAAEKGLRLRMRSSSAFVHSDPLLLERILRNLIANALRYTSKGGVLVGARRRADKVSLEVWDTGIGIPESERTRIFDEFYQLEGSARSSGKGLGLGLAIVKRLTDLLGYRIRVDSRPGHGSAFRFEVPLGEPNSAKPVAPVVQSPPALALADRLIVVVDDEAAIVEGMRVLLAAWGAEVVGSATGNDVLAELELRGRLPDLLIVDYQLGNGHLGTDVIAHLRELLDPEIPAIIVSGSTTAALADEVRARGDDLLSKPVVPGKLRQLIDARLRWKGAARTPLHEIEAHPTKDQYDSSNLA